MEQTHRKGRWLFDQFQQIISSLKRIIQTIDSFLQLHNTSVFYVRPDRIIENCNYQLMVDADPNLSIVRCDFQTLRQFSQCEHPSQAFSSVSS